MPLQIMPWIQIAISVIWNHVMPIVGVLAVLVTMLVQAGHKLPMASARDKLGRRLIGRGSRILGKTLIAVKDEDGLWTLKPATYDGENNGYWVPTADGREFYDAAGVGGDPGSWYGGTALAVAYDGLGSLAEVAAGEVGRQARIKKQTYKEDLSTVDYAKYKSEDYGKKLLAGAGKQIHNALAHSKARAADGAQATRDKLGSDDNGPFTDGGEDLIDEWETMLPKRKVVDLRDTIHAAPFNVKPQQFHRVAENAKKGQKGFASLGPIGQAGLIMGAFMLGAITCYIGFSASGGGGASISVPMGGVMIPNMEAALGVFL